MTQANTKTSDILEKARKLYHEWNFDESRELFSKVADSDNNAEEGYYGLGVIDLQSGRLDAAAKNFNNCLKENGGNADALFYLGQVYIQKGEHAKALVYLQKALKFNPKHKAGLRQHQNLLLHMLNKGKLLYKVGKLRESTECFNDVIDSGHYEAAGHYGLGVIKFQQDSLEDAESHFKKCVRLHDKHANALYYLGRIAEKNKEPETGAQFYKKALKINSKHAGANSRLDDIENPGKKVKYPPIIDDGHDELVPEPVLNPIPNPVPNPLPAPDPNPAFSLPQDRRPYFSAFAGRILFWVIVSIILLMYNYSLNHYTSFGAIDRNLANMLLFAFIVVLVGLITYIFKIRSIVYSFHQNGTLTVEKGVLGSSVKTYDLRGLQSVEPQRSFFNQITGDGKLILKLVVQEPGRGNALKILSLKGLGKWDELKEINDELNAFIAEKG